MIQGCAATVPGRRSFQTSDNVTLSVLETGPEHAATSRLNIALLTGWTMPAAIWQKQLEEFGQTYHTLALDPRGQGDSEVSSSGYTAERRATDVRDFLAPLSNVLLIGWSLGAIESLQYIYMFGADKLAGLVLVDSSVGEEPAPQGEGTFLQSLRDDRDKTLEGFVRAIFNTPQPENEIEGLVRGAKRISLQDSLALLSYPFVRTHWKEIAHAFKKPLLYIVTPQFAEQARNLQKNRPGTQIEIFENAGHALFVDEPDRFNAVIEKFAASLGK